MTISINLHSSGAWRADVHVRSSTVWVTVTGSDQDHGEITFFFTTIEHAQAVADAFNNPPPQPETGET